MVTILEISIIKDIQMEMLKKPISNNRFSFDAPFQGTRANNNTNLTLPKTRLTVEHFAADGMVSSIHTIIIVSRILRR